MRLMVSAAGATKRQGKSYHNPYVATVLFHEDRYYKQVTQEPLGLVVVLGCSVLRASAPAKSRARLENGVRTPIMK